MQKKVALLTIICSGVIGVWLVITGGFRSESSTTVIQYSSGLMNPTVISGPVQVKLLADDVKQQLPRGTVVYYETTQVDDFDRPPGQYIGRVIGLEHEVISVQEGKVFINNEPLDEPYVSSPGPISQTLEPVTVPTNSYLLLGDMRGVVPLPYVVVTTPQIIGKVVL